MQPSSVECSKPFRLLRVNGLAVKSNTVVPLKNGCHVTSAGLQPLQLFSPAQMEQRGPGCWHLIRPMRLEKQASGHKNLPKLLHQHRGDTGRKILHFRASVKVWKLVILFVMKYKWGNCTRMWNFWFITTSIILSVWQTNIFRPNHVSTQNKCVTLLQTINLPPLPHLRCLICAG